MIPNAVNSRPTSAPQMKEKHQPDADGDQCEPRDVEKYRRNPLAPTAFRCALEEGGVEPGQQQNEHHEAEHGRNYAHRSRFRRDLRAFHQEDEQRTQRHNVIAEHMDRPRQIAAAPGQGVLQLGQDHEHDR